MKACAINDIAATDGSKFATAICRDQIQICATSCDITSAVWFASPLIWACWWADLFWLCLQHILVSLCLTNPFKQQT